MLVDSLDRGALAGPLAQYQAACARLAACRDQGAQNAFEAAKNALVCAIAAALPDGVVTRLHLGNGTVTVGRPSMHRLADIVGALSGGE